ncbi:MAG: ATP-binding cassette domain-containing protein [Thermomicrobium sp.]|nr:ATP-binding cassette domain-containing protein [Thermomicrobium sp.]
MKLVEVEGLIQRFGDVVAVDGLTFSIEAGEAFALLGPNGAGKTTTIRVLVTLLRPTAGSVRIAGLDVTRHPTRVRRVLGYVPQTLSADGSLTGYENLLVVAKLLRIPRAERERAIADVLELVRLEEAADRLVRTYSGGMVRRLEIAQAILHRPVLLVLDEPTVGLDPTARRSVWDALKVLRERDGTTLLVTTHYMEEAELYCDRVAIMNRGRLVALGTAGELKAQAGGAATLDEVFTTLTGDTLESGGSYSEVRQLRRRLRRFG